MQIFLDGIPPTATTSGSVITASVALPIAAIPLTVKTGFVKVLDNSSNAIGSWTIDTGGILTIGVGVNGSPFTNSGTSDFYNLEANYNAL